jgi:hypothetical protein
MTHEVARVSKVKEAVAESLMARPNVTGVGVGYRFVGGRRTDQVCLRVYVRKKLPKSELRPEELLPESIDGVPVDVIEADFATLAGEENRRRHSPLLGGISAGGFVRGVFETTGTLGVLVFDLRLGEGVILSNWHVLCGRLGCATGDPVVQPGAGPGGDGGDEDDVVARLERAALTSRVDAAIARLTGERFLLQVNLELGPVVEAGRAALGMAVRKAGRTTGMTAGTVTDINATVSVGGYPTGVRTFVGQIVVQREGGGVLSRPGDSGSVFLDDANRVVALLFAGGPDSMAIANPIEAVMEALEVGFTGGVTLQDAIAIHHTVLA